ncbi:MAG TPA: chromate efflux transporter [Burkholderiales bacterium]|nr:chromate efflux transporter [Burkholderiales bacterium]
MSAAATGTSGAPAPVGFWQAFAYWLKLGFISFGGPTGQIAIMHQELVERRRWISEGRFLHALNYCMLLPGPEAQQLATYIGWLMHRTSGGIAAGALFVLPSLFILIALSWVYMRFGDVPWVAAVLHGVKPAVTAIVLFAAYRIASRALKYKPLWLISIAAFVAIFAFGAPFPAIILAAGVIGYAWGRFAPERFRGAGHGATAASFGPALIEDGLVLPHTRFSPTKVVGFAATGLVIWGLSLGALAAAFGWQGTLTQMGWFFTKAALLTFGGAYAVLPYVFQGTVEHYGWLTTAQMIDGLALGETTPGPLIMVVAFVGFVGAWTKTLFGPEALVAAGAAGAAVATFFTFLPSFVFILVGAPLVESTHGDIRFTAPLTGITAAVVGVIVNLAVFFAWHAFWPAGFGRPIDLFSIALAIAALIALWRFKVGIIPVIAACGTAGLVHHLVQTMT